MTDARLHGFDKAIDYLEKQTRPDPRPPGLDEDDILDASDDPGLVPRKPFPDEVLDALAILRLCRAVEDMDRDLARATELAIRFEAGFGFGETLAWRPAGALCVFRVIAGSDFRG